MFEKLEVCRPVLPYSCFKMKATGYNYLPLVELNLYRHNFRYRFNWSLFLWRGMKEHRFEYATSNVPLPLLSSHRGLVQPRVQNEICVSTAWDYQGHTIHIFRQHRLNVSRAKSLRTTDQVYDKSPDHGLLPSQILIEYGRAPKDLR